MAPRRQAKQAASESVVAAADGNVTPPKKRKTAAKSPGTDVVEPKQAKGRSRQAKADKQESEVASGPASPPKKSRGRQKNAASTATTVAKNDTKGKPKKHVNKQPEDAAVENNHAGVEVGRKGAGSGKTVATAKKAGTKTAAVKPKAKAPAARKQKTRVTDEDDAGDSGKNATGENSPKRTTRRMKAVEESDAPAQPTAKVSRKRKNVEDTDKAVTEAQVSKEKHEKEKEAKVVKKPRGRAKKVETDDAPVTTSKGRPKKNPAKEVAKPLPEEAEIKKQNGKERNAAIQENNSKTKNVKNAKKGNVKKAAPKGKLNAAAGKADEAQAEEAATPEVDVKENGEAHVAVLKQKKRNAGKANAAMNGKIEVKGKQKKGQVAAGSIDEKKVTKDVTAENETIKMNVASEIDENDTKDVSLSKDGSILDIKEENETYESKAVSTKDESNISETSIKETERSGTFLYF